VLDANEVRDKLRDLNVEGRIEVDLNRNTKRIYGLVFVFSGQELFAEFYKRGAEF